MQAPLLRTSLTSLFRVHSPPRSSPLLWIDNITSRQDLELSAPPSLIRRDGLATAKQLAINTSLKILTLTPAIEVLMEEIRPVLMAGLQVAGRIRIYGLPQLINRGSK